MLVNMRRFYKKMKRLLTIAGSLIGLLVLIGLAVVLALTLSRQTPSSEQTATLVVMGKTIVSPSSVPTEAQEVPSPTATATPGSVFESPVKTPTPKPRFWAEKIRVEQELPVEDSPVSFVVGIAWSPDGQRIAFVKPGGVWTANADGTSLQLVGEDGYLPSWSPDGSTIAYVSFKGKDEYELWTVNVETKEKERLVTTSNPTRISWLSNSQIVFVDETRLKESDMKGQGVIQIGDYRVEQMGPIGFIPSPDGKHLALDDNGVLKVIAPSTGRTVTLDNFLSILGGVSWLPGSQTLVYGKAGNGNEVWLSGVEGRSKRKLVSFTNSQPYSFSTSPDGNVIAFRASIEMTEHETVTGIVVINVDGTGLNMLIKNANAAIWSPDGSKMAFEREGYLWIAKLSF